MKRESLMCISDHKRNKSLMYQNVASDASDIQREEIMTHLITDSDVSDHKQNKSLMCLNIASDVSDNKR